MRDFLKDKEIKVHLDCYPCFLRQSIIALRLGTKDEALQEKILKAVIKDIGDTGTVKSPAHLTTGMHRRIRQMLGKDPFKNIKEEYNSIALKLYPRLKEIVSSSTDPLWTAARLAIAGNVIDFGLFTSVDIEGTVKRALNHPLTVDDYQPFKKEIQKAEEILYLLDNAGEAVFDRILIETLIASGKKVTTVVKGSPVINDCTMDDAIQTGIAELTEVIENGSDAVGTILETTHEDFRKRYHHAELIISKGQGNFETLLQENKKIFFLFQSKCDVVSKVLGISKDSMLLAGNQE
jgi:hypothetical protein